MNSLKQDEDKTFYMARLDGGKQFIKPPVLMRIVGVFFPHRGSDEVPIHLERFNQETQTYEVI